MNEAPNSFAIQIEAKVDFRAKTKINIGHYGSAPMDRIVLINVTHGMCTIGNMETFDGGCTYHFSYQGNYGIRDQEGLQFFDMNTMQWRYFDDSVQEAYAQYALEKAIK
jgi:hypothetical protein